MPFFRVSNQSLRWLLAELAVVVLGILLAFQIEEWRQDRADRAVTNANLEAILFELADELIDLRLVINDTPIASTAAAELVSFVVNGESRDENWIIRTYNAATNVTPFRPNSPTYTGLRETGQFYLVPDFALRAELFDYYEFAAYIDLLAEARVSNSKEVRDTALRDIFSIPVKQAETGEITRQTYLVKPIEEFPRHPDFLGAVSRLGSSMISWLPRLHNMQERNLALQQTIRDHLASEGIVAEVPDRTRFGNYDQQ